MNRLFLLFLTTLLSVSLSSQSQPIKAFPTAEGFGKFASGGRGGKVVEVTNLTDSGEGSLRWALTEAGREHATIVFRVSGIITFEKDIVIVQCRAKPRQSSAFRQLIQIQKF